MRNFGRQKTLFEQINDGRLLVFYFSEYALICILLLDRFEESISFLRAGFPFVQLEHVLAGKGIMNCNVELTQGRRSGLRLLAKLAQLILEKSTTLKLSLHEALKARVKFAKVLCQMHIQQLTVVFAGVRLQIQRVFNAFCAAFLVRLLSVCLIETKRNACLARLLNCHKLVYAIQRSLLKNLQFVLHIHYAFFH